MGRVLSSPAEGMNECRVDITSIVHIFWVICFFEICRTAGERVID
jgi:hypothetical protein